MADNNATGGTGDEDNTNGRLASNEIVNRRSYMKLAGLTAATVGLSGVGSAVSEDPLLIVDGTGTSESTTYLFDVSGEVERIERTNNTDDTIDAGQIEGIVGDDVNAYRVTGDLTRAEYDGPAAFRFGTTYDDLLPADTSVLTVISPPAPSDLSYEFTTTGEITKLLDNGDNSADKGNDAVTQNDDGTWTATGRTGNGYGDAFEFTGEIVHFTPLAGNHTLELDGTVVSPWELTGPTHELTIISAPAPSDLSYGFTTTGEITKLLDNGDNSADKGNDTVTQNDDGTWTATGRTGNGYGDAFEFEGAMTDFSSSTSDFTLELDGFTVTPDDLVGSTSSDDSGSSGSGETNIGGGDGYQNTVSASDADVVVTTERELRNALSNTGGGDLVYVDGDAQLDVTGTSVSVPSGVTLASNRGVNGSSGALLYTTVNDGTVVSAGGNARVTGLRVRGPATEWQTTSPDYPNDVGRGILCAGSGTPVEVDNCEVWGFRDACVASRQSDHVHHNHIHHAPMDGLGYGVLHGGGFPIIEYNHLDYCRHVIASGGGDGYTARYNHIGPNAMAYNMGTHRPGGTRIEFYNNTFEMTNLIDPHPEDWLADVQEASIIIRGVPDDVASIHHNWFYNPDEPGSTPKSSFPRPAIHQEYSDGQWKNVEWSNNHYGSDEPSTDIGHPR